MKPLHDQARRVILEGRSADASPRGSRARNWHALVSRLDVPLPPTAAGVNRALSRPVGGSAWNHALIKFTLWGVLLGGFGGGFALYGSGRSARSEVKTLATQPQQAAPPASPLMAAVSAVPADGPAEHPVRPPARAHRTPPTAAGLAAETRLIAQAQSKLNDGAPARALVLLEQHRTEFPHGELVPEREAARVLTLCALGRAAEAKVARTRFERDFSNSPLLARVRAGCTGD